MKKYPLIGGSIVAVVILIAASLSNVVGFQTVQSSNQNVISDKVDQKDLLFQTILDIANNKEIQRIILKSQSSRGIFPILNIPVLTRNRLKHMYFIGLLLSKIFSKSRIQSMVQQYQLINPKIQQEMNVVVEKDATLKEEITQLSYLECDCENDGTTGLWHFPIICTLLMPFYAAGIWLFLWGWRWHATQCENIGALIVVTIVKIASLLGCRWYLNQNNQFPYISDISPADGEQNVSLSLTELSFHIHDVEGDLMSYKVETFPNIGYGNGTLVPNGTYVVPIHGLQNNSMYAWRLYLYEGDTSGTPLGKTYTFTTESLAPFILNPSPRQNAEFVPISTSNVSFDLRDDQGYLMNWTVETQPDIGSGFGTDVGNGRYTVPISGLDYFTTYTWFVNVTAGPYRANKTFSFRTTTENTVVLEPTDDATITENDPNGNSGTSETIALRSMSWYEWDDLIKFNLSAIPSNVTILYAALQAYYYNNHDGNPSGHHVNVYRITSDWNEETVTWNTHPSYVADSSSSAIMPSTINDWVFWNLTGDVLMFYNSSTPNYGWRIMDTSGDNIISYFQSKENSGNHPLLIIGYK